MFDQVGSDSHLVDHEEQLVVILKYPKVSLYKGDSLQYLHRFFVVQWSNVADSLVAIVKGLTLDLEDCGPRKALSKRVLHQLLFLVQRKVPFNWVFHHLSEEVDLLSIHLPKHHVLLLAAETLL